MTYLKNLPKLLKHATPAEKKELIRAWMEGIRLVPERLEVEVTYRIPEPVVNEAAATGRGHIMRTARTLRPGRFFVGSGGPVRSRF